VQEKRYRPVFLSVDLEVTNLCNTLCSICPRERIRREMSIMSLSTVDTIIEKLNGYKPLITISGIGDPLLHPQLAKIIDKFKSADHNIGVVLNIASIIDCKEEIFLEMIRKNPDHITISVPSINPLVIQKIYNGKITERQIIDRLFWIKETSAGRITIRISSLTTGNRDYDENGLKELAQRLKMQLWLSPIHSRGGNLGESELYKQKGIQQNTSCSLFVFHTFIDCRGKILACCHDLKGDTEFADISDGIEEILLRKQVLLERVPPFILCNRCDEPLRFLRLPNNLERLTYRQLFKKLRAYTGRTENR